MSRSAARRPAQALTTRPVGSPLPGDAPLPAWEVAVRMLRRGWLSMHRRGLVGGTWTGHWGAPVIRQHRELAADGWVPPAARDQACDVSPDGHLDVALMVTLIPRSPRQPSRAHREIAHRGPARAGSFGEDRWRHAVEPQFGPAEERGRAGVVDGDPVQVDETAAGRPLNVGAFNVRGDAVRIPASAEPTLECPPRGRCAARVRPSNSSRLPRRAIPT